MAKDNSAWLENILSAGVGSDAPPDMRDARCPKCGASDFAPISDLYSESAYRLEDGTEPADVARASGMTDTQIARKFAPPRRKSAVGPMLVVALPLAAAAYYVYHRF